MSRNAVSDWARRRRTAGAWPPGLCFSSGGGRFQGARASCDRPSANTRAFQKEAPKMSDQHRRERLPSETEDIEETGEDVEAHVTRRDANDEGEDGEDTVKARVKARR